MDLTVIVIVVVVTALAFDFTNGFRDTANAKATSIATKALSERSMGPVPGFDVLAGRYGPSANAR